jgi:hypothetical protein
MKRNNSIIDTKTNLENRKWFKIVYRIKMIINYFLTQLCHLNEIIKIEIFNSLKNYFF